MVTQRKLIGMAVPGGSEALGFVRTLGWTYSRQSLPVAASGMK